jgi:hypothetical protein
MGVAKRLHTWAAVALVATVPLVPFGFWTYAKVAGVDRGAQVAHAKQLLATAGPPAGSRNLGFQVYAQRAWDGENLVPISSYTVETAYRLPARLTARVIRDHYRRELAGWLSTVDASGNATFTRGRDTLSIDIYEYLTGKTGVREYGVIVSQ